MPLTSFNLKSVFRSKLALVQRTSLVLAMSLLSPLAAAAPYYSTYTGTIGTEFGETPFPELIEGQSYTVTLVFDNGGTTAVNQTWVQSNLTCVLFKMNNAGNVRYAQNLIVTNAELSVAGALTTGASGALTAIFSELDDSSSAVSAGEYSTANFPSVAPEIAWYLNSANDVFFSDPNYAFGDAAGGVQMNIANWTNPAPFSGACSAATSAASGGASTVSAPATDGWAKLLLVGMLGLSVFATLRRRARSA